MQKTIHNVQNGQIEIVDLTKKEIDAINLESAKLKEITAQIEIKNNEKALQKNLILEKLGITEEEARLLLS